MWTCYAKTAERIDALFEVENPGYPRSAVLDDSFHLPQEVGRVQRSLCQITLASCPVSQHHSINQSINVKFVGRRYTTRPGAPTVVSGKHDQKVHA